MTTTAAEPFLWGVATSAFQIEGSPSADWTGWDPLATVQPFMTGHYERFREDVALLRELGVNAYRFSVEWSRIQPRERVWDTAALEHYRQLVDELLANGIEPVLTLHHTTHPVWFHEATPWDGGKAAGLFAAFTRRVVDTFPDVKIWITFNEPMIMLLGGYLDGCMPPGKRDRHAAARALAGVLDAHARAYAIIHARIPEARVGIAHNMAAFAPLRGWHPLDRLLARLGRRGFNLAILEAFRTGRTRLTLPFARPIPVVAPVKGTLDFLGVNYYQRLHLGFRFRGGHAHSLDVLHCDRSGRGLTDMGWEEHPEGLAAVLREAAAVGVPLMLTENGIAAADDTRKISFIRRHVAALDAARRDGIDIRGYFYWSLTDTYEWLHGLHQRFGLYRIDWGTLERVPTAAAAYYAALVRKRRAGLTIT
ncbi:MAG: glycoside hydrolase family 1 protein [Candidatus Methylomirabilia bacterium]